MHVLIVIVGPQDTYTTEKAMSVVGPDEQAKIDAVKKCDQVYLNGSL